MYKNKIKKITTIIKKIPIRPKSVAKTLVNFYKICFEKIFSGNDIESEFEENENEESANLDLFEENFSERTELCKKLHLKDNFQGIFTFVLTDIVDSTSKWEKQEKKMKDAVFKHHELGDRLINKFNGYEIKREGDSFLVAFENEENAIQFSEKFIGAFGKNKENQSPDNLNLSVRVIIIKCNYMAFYANQRFIFHGCDYDKIASIADFAGPGIIKRIL